jgi:hypothetical protein
MDSGAMVRVVPYTSDFIPAVKEFNSRLGAGRANTDLRFPEWHIPQWLPRTDDRRIYEEYFLAVEGDAVRGGYMLKHQDFSFRGEVRSVGYVRWLLSEGIINRKYGLVGPLLLRNALRAQPILYGFAGGTDVILAQMLKRAGWPTHLVPFYFKVTHAEPFLRQIRPLRKTAAKRLIMDIAAVTRAGGVALGILQSAREKRSAGDERVESIVGFSSWADDLWDQCRSRYDMIAVRDSRTLNILYPAGNSRFLCYKVHGDKQLLGWAVLLDTQMHDNKYFGNLRVGSIVDCAALPESAFHVIRGATRVLKERGVDLIVSNQLHSAWSIALRDAGFLQGPSNFLFAVSKELSNLLQPFQARVSQIHMTRGDGDGPIHL